MYGQRVIAEMLNFCKDIREAAEPGAVMLNYSNPNAMATWACNKYGGVKTIGLCHGEIHGEMQIAEVLGIPREELDIVCAGINHQTGYSSVKHHGEDRSPKLLERLKTGSTWTTGSMERQEDISGLPERKETGLRQITPKY